MAIYVRLRPFLIAIGIILICFGIYYYWETNIKIVPEKLMEKSAQKIMNLENYRYTVDFKLLANGHERKISSIVGERAGKEGFHLKGQIQGTPIEAYHIEETTYLKAGDQEKWMVIPGNKVFDQDLFMVEIDPLAGLKFIKVENLVYTGRVEVDGQKLHQLNFTPELNHPFMNKHWTDFQYTCWLKQNGELVKAEIEAELKAKPADKFYLTIGINEYNSKIKLEPPA